MAETRDERQAGRSVPSSRTDSRWRQRGDDPLSAGDDDPGGWNGGHDRGEPRPHGRDERLTGISGDSVRDQGIASGRTADTGRSGAGATTAAHRSPDVEGPRVRDFDREPQRSEDAHLGWGREGEAYAPAEDPRTVEDKDEDSGR